MLFFLALFVVPAVVVLGWSAFGWWQPPGRRAQTFYMIVVIICVLGMIVGGLLWYLPTMSVRDGAHNSDDWTNMNFFAFGVGSFFSLIGTIFLWLLGGLIQERQKYAPRPPEEFLPRI